MTTEQLRNPLKKLYVYRNLRLNCLSLMQSGVVVGHASAVILTDVEFRVRESGRQRVLRERCKNVHAFTIGMLEKELGTVFDSIFFRKDARRVTYNPYRYSTFFDVNNGNPVYSGERVLVTANDGIYVED